MPKDERKRKLTQEAEERQLKRKERHNEVERKRRTLMNDKLNELRSLLPDCNPETSKADCLVSAVSYINWLHQQSSAIYQELQRNGIPFRPEALLSTGVEDGLGEEFSISPSDAPRMMTRRRAARAARGLSPTPSPSPSPPPSSNRHISEVHNPELVIDHLEETPEAPPTTHTAAPLSNPKMTILPPSYSLSQPPQPQSQHAASQPEHSPPPPPPTLAHDKRYPPIPAVHGFNLTP
eukprot:TRINITY_DN25440_c0_g1_i1.p1 TRINITY_DN25440_c0_g1~~TRINITY_DN25440_c0_g1_i1.p1  ORF type:complete len:236 (-),score=22.98 TRINITY_DN25440_c0_g1_i1:24-731(-)